MRQARFFVRWLVAWLQLFAAADGELSRVARDFLGELVAALEDIVHGHELFCDEAVVAQVVTSLLDLDVVHASRRPELQSLVESSLRTSLYGTLPSAAWRLADVSEALPDTEPGRTTTLRIATLCASRAKIATARSSLVNTWIQRLEALGDMDELLHGIHEADAALTRHP